MQQLRNISVVGLGLLGGSIALAARQRLPGVRVIGYSRSLDPGQSQSWGRDEIVDDLAATVGAPTW
jgi:prephenate dehydrogenase